MNRIKTLIGISAFTLLVLALPSVASAQWRGQDRNDDYYGRNGGYYGGNYSNLRGVVERLENRARTFERQLDRIDDRRDNGRWGNGRWGNNGRVDSLEVLSDRFSRAASDLRNEFGRGRNMNNSRDEARRVLDLGSQIESQLSRSRVNRNAERHWRQISNDLRIIANAYSLAYNGGRGTWRNNVPFPLPF